jgi:tripartite-type tricarboxylate transporter receptor subunit TctC
VFCTRRTRAFNGLAAGLVCGWMACMPSWAQTYPDRPIRVIVPMQAGTAGDTVMRIVTQRISASMGQMLVILNVPEAAGRVGEERIALASADGYTIGAMGDSLLTVLPHLQSRLHVDPIADFEPVSLVALVTSVLVLHPSVPANNVRELVALARSRPAALDFASAGVGSQQHMAMELFMEATGTRLTHIPLRGAGQAAMEVVSGRIPATFVALSIAMPFIKEGRLRAVGVASRERSALLPDLPTLSESGVPGFVLAPWVGIYAPKGTARSVVERLNLETVAALNDPGVRPRLMALGLEPQASSPEELGQRTRADHARMGRLIRAAGIKGE